MDVHVVVVGLEAMNLGAVNHAKPLACGDQEMIADSNLLTSDNNGGSTMLWSVEPITDSIERTAEALFVIRLQEIIDSTKIKCGERMGVMSSDENQKRGCADFELRRHLKTVQSWHLNVQEYDVWRVPEDRLGRTQSVGIFSSNLYVGLAAEPAM